MTSRNKSQGRYAGKFRGLHCRTHNVVGKKYKMDMPWSTYKLWSLPSGHVAWGILATRDFGMMVTKIEYSEG